VAIDVRFIAASNRDLEAMVKAGSFRQDLFYRLNVFPIQLTPLSQRPEDIEPLVLHFMEKHGRKNNRPAMTIEPRALAALKKQAWPGNVRELENLIERAVLFSRGGRIRLADLRLTEGSKGEPEEGLLEAASRAAARAEAELIGRVLAECGGNKSQTAKRLKISYRVMLKKIRDYRLE
jgi:DNA-binding NtrC family response regulator